MPQATDQQMQAYADQRVRPFAEQARALYLAAKDHKAAIDDEYARAAGANAWADARTDGPPHLLVAGGGANPDDFLNFNAYLTAFISFIETGTSVTGQSAAWAVLQRACVRTVTG